MLGSQLCNCGLFTYASGLDSSECENWRRQPLPENTQAQPSRAGLSGGGVHPVHEI